MFKPALTDCDSLLELSSGGCTNLSDFRDEVRTFCELSLPADTRAKVLAGAQIGKEDHLRWHKILAERGWLIGHWPVEHGGHGWSRLQRWVFENELYRAGSPWLIPFGVTYVGPVIYQHGSEEQKQRFLGPIRDAQTWWAQGYSEPGSGSDLASLKTSAVRDGNEYVVNGQKVWTTMAHWADFMFTLVRTDPDVAAQKGISFLLLDLKSPGVTVRPIRSIDGDDHLNEVFLENVRVPVANLVGVEGQGWTYAKELLDNERLLAAEVGKARRLMAQLEEILETVQSGGEPLSAQSMWRRRTAELSARTLSLECLAYEFFRDAEAGNDPGPAASTLKIIGSDLMQAISLALLEAVGHESLGYRNEALGGTGATLANSARDLHAGGVLAEYLYGRAYTIYGGTSEIQRNIISKAVLGL